MEIVTIPLEEQSLLASSPFKEGETTSGGGITDVPNDEWNDDAGL